jgi:hypothetical protein
VKREKNSAMNDSYLFFVLVRIVAPFQLVCSSDPAQAHDVALGGDEHHFATFGMSVKCSLSATSEHTHCNP